MERNSDWYEQWRDKYFNKPVVDLKKHFTEEELEQLRKLGVVIKDKIYTEYEFELLDNQTIMFYKDDDMTPDELECCEDLDATGATREQLNALLKKISEINILYGF